MFFTLHTCTFIQPCSVFREIRLLAEVTLIFSNRLWDDVQNEDVVDFGIDFVDVVLKLVRSSFELSDVVNEPDEVVKVRFKLPFWVHY